MNYQDLKDKLRRHYFELQKEKLANDPYYKKLRMNLVRSMEYSVGPVIKISHENGIEYETPETVKWCSAQIEDYVTNFYPILSQTEERTTLLNPWNYSFIKTPDRLDFDKIDARLTLFPKYLKYKLDHFFDWNIMTYDEWLYMKGYEQLIEVIWS